LTSQNTRNIATVAYNLGFDLAVVDVVWRTKKTVLTKVSGKLTVLENVNWLVVEK
jgi:hypothetical protein